MNAKHAPRRQQVDLLTGPIFKNLVIFAIPLLISNVFQQCYNLVDTIIVAHYLGDASLAAIGACTSIYDMLVGFALGIGSGLSVVTARNFGKGDTEQVKRSVATAMVIGLCVSVIIAAVAQLVLRPLLTALQTPAEIIDQSFSYISSITLFTIVMFGYNLFAGLLRAIGNSVMPLIFLILASILNIGLDILFITRFGLGVAGAAYATVLAQAISAVLCLLYMVKKARLLIPKRHHFRPDTALYGEMLGQGLAMGLMHSIVSAGTVVLQYGINGFGTLIIAGHTTARKIYLFCLMPFSSITHALSTFVAQNRGAQQKDRIRKAIRYCYIYDFSMAGAMSILLWLFAPALVRLVSGSSEPVLIQNASLYLRVVGPFYAILGILIQTRNSLQSLGEKLLPTLFSFTELFVKFLFVVVMIPHWGYLAVVFCEPIIWCIMSVQAIIALRLNRFMRSSP